MRVLFWGTYDTGKPRNRILRKGILAAGMDLQEIHAPVWEGIEDKSQVRGLASRLTLLIRWLSAYPGLAWRLWRAPKPDLYLIGYPGLLDIFVIAPIARLQGIPIAWDVFLSAYDTICEDRQLLRPKTLPARFLHWIEGLALRRADILFMDTRSHAHRLEQLFGLVAGQCDFVWVGAELEHFDRPSTPSLPASETPEFRVLFYGQFIPLHGVETIIEAARLLRHEPIDWQLIGRGQEAGHIRQMLADDPLQRVQWVDWVAYDQLKCWLAGADLCLGIFGTSDKAASVIPNKVFQIIAAGRPIVTRDSPAIRELLSPAARCTYLVPAGDARALADAVLVHHRETTENGSVVQCHQPLTAQIAAAAIGQQFLAIIQRRLRGR
ncbi:glycosyltransferase [Lysobacter sp. A286]